MCRPKKSPGWLEIVGLVALLGGATILLGSLVRVVWGLEAEARVWGAIAWLLMWAQAWRILGWKVD